MVWREAEGVDIEIYWLRLNPGCVMSELCNLGQLPPSKPQFPHLANYMENLMSLLRNHMYFFHDEKMR